jgi:hypothetical protein
MAKRKMTNNDLQNITQKTADRAAQIPQQVSFIFTICIFLYYSIVLLIVETQTLLLNINSSFNGAKKSSFIFSIALKWIVNSICDHQISNWCREIFKYNTVKAISVKFIVGNIWVRQTQTLLLNINSSFNGAKKSSDVIRAELSFIYFVF